MAAKPSLSLKSYFALHVGEHKCPNPETEQDFAPFWGGFRDGHGMAVYDKKYVVKVRNIIFVRLNRSRKRRHNPHPNLNY